MSRQYVSLAFVDEYFGPYRLGLTFAGCDPMLEDIHGQNAIHYAVMCQVCLDPMLDTIKARGVPCNLDAFDYGKSCTNLRVPN
jgi:hypothetical protein